MMQRNALKIQMLLDQKQIYEVFIKRRFNHSGYKKDGWLPVQELYQKKRRNLLSVFPKKILLS